MKGLDSVFAAYLVIWVLIVVYMLRLDGKAKSLAREVKELRQELEEARRRAKG